MSVGEREMRREGKHSMAAIDRATFADIEELVELRLGYLSEDFGELSDEQRREISAELVPYLRFHLGRDLRVTVARTDECIACTAWLLLVDKPPSPRFPHGRTGVLFNVFTRSTHRRQGLARRVMQELLDDARTMGLDVVELHATDDGYELYKSLGFADDSSSHRPMRLML